MRVPMTLCFLATLAGGVIGVMNTPACADWSLQSALPTDRHLYGIAFTDAMDGYAVGINRHLLETTDGGATWTVPMSSDFGTDPFYAIAFPDPMHAYLTGNNNDAWRTTDGGATWSQMTSLQAGSWTHLDFLNGVTGFAGANGACSFTSDAGATWVLRSGYPNCPVVYGMDFRDTQVGLVAGYQVASNQPGIWKTTDGGVSWTRKYANAPNDLSWVDATTAFAATGTTFIRSTDSGESWTTIGSGIWTGLQEFVRAAGDVYVGVSGKGDIWRSTNGGSAWTMVLDGLGDLPAEWSIFFVDGQRGWVAGQSGILLSTEDSGLTWKLLNSGAGVQIYELSMADDDFGIAACQNGYILRTTDGGAFWETQKVEVTGQIFGRDESLQSVSVLDRLFSVVAGPGGTVFKTLDGGVTWESIGYPNLSGLFWIEDVEFTDPQNGWLVGIDLDIGVSNAVYRTTDGGASWFVGIEDNVAWYAVDFVDADRGWILSSDRYFVRTTDGGATWIDGILPAYFIEPPMSDIEFADAQNGWAVGWFGYMAMTTDGGVTWTRKDLGTADDDLVDIGVVSATDVWVTGREEGTYRGFTRHTTDGGLTWAKELLTESPYLPTSVAGRPSGAAWVGGYNGHVLHRPGDVTSAPRAGTPVDASVLALRSAPNPFRNSTSFAYHLPASGRVVLEIFDVEGRRVASPIDELQSAGEHVASWQPGLRGRRAQTAAAAGVYLARLTLELPSAGDAAARRLIATKRIVRLP